MARNSVIIREGDILYDDVIHKIIGPHLLGKFLKDGPRGYGYLSLRKPHEIIIRPVPEHEIGSRSVSERCDDLVERFGISKGYIMTKLLDIIEAECNEG